MYIKSCLAVRCCWHYMHIAPASACVLRPGWHSLMHCGHTSHQPSSRCWVGVKCAGPTFKAGQLAKQQCSHVLGQAAGCGARHSRLVHQDSLSCGLLILCSQGCCCICHMCCMNLCFQGLGQLRRLSVRLLHHLKPGLGAAVDTLCSSAAGQAADTAPAATQQVKHVLRLFRLRPCRPLPPIPAPTPTTPPNSNCDYLPGRQR